MIGASPDRDIWWGWAERLSEFDDGPYLFGAGGQITFVPLDGSEFYLGMELHLEDGVHYGWIALNFNGPLLAEVSGWAYETEPGKSITAGAIPEPSVVLLGMASGMLGRRRRG